MEDENSVDSGTEAEPTKPGLARWREHISTKSAKAEAAFLSLLRYSALLVAAVGILGCVLYLGMGMFKQLGTTQVEAENVSLAADDIVPSSLQALVNRETRPHLDAGIGPNVRKRTLAIYRARFRGFERGDTKITEQQIVDFVWTPERIAAYDKLSGLLRDANGAILHGRDAVMLDALGLVDGAAQSSEFRKPLAAFRDARKVNVCTDQVQSRTKVVASWNEYATDCPGWFNPPLGCSTSRVIQEPFETKVCELKFPDGLEAPGQQFAAAVQRYADTADAKLTQARNDADEKTAQNQVRKLEGIAEIGTGAKLFLGFLAVMFLYLLVAMERHQRNLRALIEKEAQ
jgi:hypothetical protein